MTETSTRPSRIVHILLLAGLLIAGLLGTALVAAMRPDAILAANLCTGASVEDGKIYIDKTAAAAGNNFDYVAAESESVDLDPCIGSASGGGSYILGANLQDDGTSNIIQLGYGKQCSIGCSKRFYYTPDGHGVPVLWPGDLIPEATHRYKFEIKKYTLDPTKAWYKISDVDTGDYNVRYGDWDGNYDRAWWGAETIDTSAQLGVNGTGEDLDLDDMAYSILGSSTVWYRSGLTGYNVEQPIGSEEHAHITNGHSINIHNH